MINKIVYLIKSDIAEKGLIHPSELKTDGYFGFGNFYIIGHEKEGLNDYYEFDAILGNQVITTQIERHKNSKSYYIVQVENIGTFKFYAQPIAKKLPYVGGISSFESQITLRRLRAWDHDKLDDACRKYNFYFIGSRE